MDNNNNAVSVLNNFSQVSWQMALNLTVQSGKTQYFFGNVKRLQDTLLQRFFVVTNSNLTLAQDGSTSLVAESTLDKCYVYLQNKNSENLIDGVPLTQFKVNTTSSATNPAYTFPGFDNQDIDWERSYIQMPSATATTETGKILQVQIQFVWKADCPNWNQK